MTNEEYERLLAEMKAEAEKRQQMTRESSGQSKEGMSKEELIKMKVLEMVEEDRAAGKEPPTERMLDVWHDNVATRVYGRSLDDSEKFWKVGEQGEKQGVNKKEVSFREAISPFYKDALDDEVLAARRYARENLTGEKAPKDGPLSGADFDKFLGDARLDQKITISEAKNPGESNPIRAYYHPKDDSIVMGEEFKYSTGKPILMMGDEGVKTIPTRGLTYDDVLQHEMGHSMFKAGSPRFGDAEDGGWNPNLKGPDYYDNPNEMMTELAHAQRQRFKQMGKRFGAESFEKFLKDVEKNPKLLEEYSPMTRNAIRNLLKGEPEEKNMRIKQAAKVIPALVRNEKKVDKTMLS
jgi:hypothetical protein